jgi:AcrR family transcriptional regulator
MKPRPQSLRDRQAQQVRTSILDSALAGLESMAADELSMADIAEGAGISLRTLYRHFPDRASVLAAAGDHYYAALDVPITIASPEDIASSFRLAARQLSDRPELARALVHSRSGRASRSRVRTHRAQAISVAVGQLTEGLEPALARKAKAVITHLCSAAAWVETADDSGLPDAEAQEAVAWAIQTLVDSLRDPSRTPSRRQAGDARPAHKELS